MLMHYHSDVTESEVNPWQDNEYFIKYFALPTIFWMILYFAYKVNVLGAILTILFVLLYLKRR